MLGAYYTPLDIPAGLILPNKRNYPYWNKVIVCFPMVCTTLTHIQAGLYYLSNWSQLQQQVWVTRKGGLRLRWPGGACKQKPEEWLRSQNVKSNALKIVAELPQHLHQNLSCKCEKCNFAFLANKSYNFPFLLVLIDCNVSTSLSLTRLSSESFNGQSSCNDSKHGKQIIYGSSFVCGGRRRGTVTPKSP